VSENTQDKGLFRFWVSTLWDGIYHKNPIFLLALSLCPALAVTSNLKDAFWMGMAVAFVATASELLVSLVRDFISPKIRIPAYLALIGSFVTVVDLLMHAYQPDVYRSLGMYLALIVVFTLLLARCEVFASKVPPLIAMADGLGMGIGFFLGMLILAFFRELLGSGTIGTITVLPEENAAIVMKLGPGGFITLGLLMGFFNWIKKKEKMRRQKPAARKNSKDLFKTREIPIAPA
jgi:electron transport complex protein RnfE